MQEVAPAAEQAEEQKEANAKRERIVLEEMQKTEEKNAERRARSLTKFIRTYAKH